MLVAKRKRVGDGVLCPQGMRPFYHLKHITIRKAVFSAHKEFPKPDSHPAFPVFYCKSSLFRVLYNWLRIQSEELSFDNI